MIYFQLEELIEKTIAIFTWSINLTPMASCANAVVAIAASSTLRLTTYMGTYETMFNSKRISAEIIQKMYFKHILFTLKCYKPI